jgi:protein-S-isoprenylcysteine O-methyltransferase Ste14
MEAAVMAALIIGALGAAAYVSFAVWRLLGLPEGPYHPALSVAGAFLFAAGFAALVWTYSVFPPLDMLSTTIRSLPRELAFALRRVSGRSASGCRGSGVAIVAEGPYRCVRHPVYSSALIMFVGLGLIKGPFLLLAAASLPVYYALALVEEWYLDYETCGGYSSSVKARYRLNPLALLACLAREIRRA